MTIGNELALIALEPLHPKDWISQSDEVLRAAGMSTIIRNNKLNAWSKVKRSQSISYSDGFIIKRLWLGPRRGALTVTSKRLYFSADGNNLDFRPERMVVHDNRPESPPVLDMIAAQWGLLGILKENLQLPDIKPVALNKVECDLSAAREVKIGTHVRLTPPASLNEIYRDLGFDAVPPNFTIIMCPLDGVPPDVVNRFVWEINGAARGRNVDVTFRLSNANEIRSRLEELQLKETKITPGRCILFLFSRRNSQLSTEARALFEALETKEVPFRRAYGDDQLDFSIPDQLPSLLMAAGGKPHKSSTYSGNHPVWTVGVDLGHNMKRSKSTLVVTLVNPEGALTGTWTKLQPRDETPKSSALSELLASCASKLKSLDTKPKTVILRDGRKVENESIDIYDNAFGKETSFFEYRKGGNPQLVQMNDVPSIVPAPIAAMVPGVNTMFISLAPPRTREALSRFSKVSWQKEWNRLEIKSTELAKLLVSSATAPGLGLQSRNLPAAIYWADGVAGASDEDLRFRGQKVAKL